MSVICLSECPQYGLQNIPISYIPEETQVSINTYTMQRDPRNFSPLPEAFWPERWLLAAGDTSVKFPRGIDADATFVHNTSAFVPFSHGPMNCVGRPLAMMQMRMVVCVLVQRFTMRFPAHYDPARLDQGLKDVFIWDMPSLPAILERRNSESLLQRD